MPALLPTPELADVAIRATGNATTGLQVVCAWPVSGQYGPGSRVLYYVLVAACVLARNIVWLRKACLAAALLLPAVGSLHALVLASLHVNGVVDMDIYGAFQLCSIAILAAPLTVRLSKTYFYDPGRNLIFLWTGLILAGLLALAVEFYRVTPIVCPNPVRGGKDFPYGTENCTLICSEDDPKSPYSALRAGPAANIGVIPVPTILTFNTGMLLATACCVPAVVSLIFTLDKILALHWKRRFGHNEQTERNRSIEPIEGTNGATEAHMDGVNGAIRRVLSVVEIPLFSSAILAILIAGEINFFSHQVRWETEPIYSVGQWGPIAGTVLAALGSLYVLAMTGEEQRTPQNSSECTCGNQLQRQPTFTLEEDSDGSPSQISLDDHGVPMSLRRSHETFITNNSQPRKSTDPGGRRRVAEMLQKAGDKLGSAAHNKYDAKQYNSSRAREFPEIPGEAARNPELTELKRQYSLRRDVVLREENSRAVSPSPSNLVFPDMEGSPSTSPVLGQSEFSESPERMTTRREALEVSSPTQTSFPDPERGRTPARRATLEVPSPTKAAFSGTDRNAIPARRATLEVPSPTESSQNSVDRDRTHARRATLEVPSPTHRPSL
ncbi:hypothetical protein P171DRAFT_415370 [Karstenula rhodostoma CBS 690.94]|uniref:Uncharacterized protein n=1 Tax=Karstenula rhodostoma CBS 690.94 TaxID=1392251 RepID=A0A9P4PIW7_9PLEO|nr:hypothetical protein P171DRAFT_415370 [Karstenula rhodostoma CBS 690.94]